MKRFRFENIWMLSHVERKARHVRFHPKKNLIRGRNHTGKTSLIRSLFETLWAKPQGKLERWDPNTVVLLEFSIDGTSFFALRQNERHALFDSDSKLIVSTASFGEWCQTFRSCTGFNLVFSDKNESAVVPADPACFFLPFYVNQDGSWQADWNTFTGLKRYNRPQSAILEYFTGVCPPEYYQARAERSQENNILEERRKEYKLLERTIERFVQTVSLTGPKVDPENFKADIAQLTEEVTKLNERQEKLRMNAVRERELEASLDLQIRLADEALEGFNRDATFLRVEGAAPLICPTCHAEHERPFLDLLEFAEDARVLRELSARLREEVAAVRQRCQATFDQLSTLNAQYARISEILAIRKGELKVGDVVDSIGAERAFAAFEAERHSLRCAIDKAVLMVDELAAKMKDLRSPQRTKEILKSFRASYENGRVALKLPPVKVSNMQLTSRPNLSGSGGPRSVLAYYAALWRATHSPTSSFDIPVIIDSPNQQAQDDVNLPAVLHFIAEGLPQDMQLIVGLETKADFEFDMELHLDAPYELLRAEQWKEVETVLDPMLERMYAALLPTKGVNG